MSFKTIRAKCIARTGSTATDLSYMNRLINDAAEELYRSDDLVGSTKEFICAIPATDTKIMALPYYIQEIRGIRWYDSGFQIVQNDKNTRYQNNGRGIHMLNWRDLDMSPLQLQILNASTLILSIPIGETETISISIVGSTPNSARIEEIVTIPVGELEVETVNDFDNVFSITKQKVNKYNISVSDAEGNVLAEIPNNELTSRYKLIQIRDDRVIGVTALNSGVEVLYKEKFNPMVNDNDQFLDGRYDDAIYWKFLEHWFSTQDGKEDDALMSRSKCSEILMQIGQDNTATKDKYIQAAPNPFYAMMGKSLTRW